MFAADLATKTVAVLRKMAAKADVSGRSKMRKDDLIAALAEPDQSIMIRPTVRIRYRNRPRKATKSPVPSRAERTRLRRQARKARRINRTTAC